MYHRILSSYQPIVTLLRENIRSVIHCIQIERSEVYTYGPSGQMSLLWNEINVNKNIVLCSCINKTEI